MSLSLSTSSRSGWTVLSVAGAIDVQTAPQLRGGIADIVEGGGQRVVVDLSEVSFLDSSGLGALVGAHKDLTGRRGNLVVACGEPRLLRVFQLTRLHEVLSIVPTVDDAVG